MLAESGVFVLYDSILDAYCRMQEVGREKIRADPLLEHVLAYTRLVRGRGV
jgi:hypothetical protein